MNLKTKVQQFDSNRARIAVEWLANKLASPPFRNAEDLAGDIRSNRENHIRWLTKEPSACKTVEYFAHDVFRAEQNRCPLDDPPLVSNASALLYLLLMGYERSEASEATLARLEAAHEATLRLYLGLSSPQVDPFVDMCEGCGIFLGTFRFQTQG
jgi:hypothetical protein